MSREPRGAHGKWEKSRWKRKLHCCPPKRLDGTCLTGDRARSPPGITSCKPSGTRRTQPLSAQGRGSWPPSGVGSPKTPSPSQPVLCQLPAGQRRFSSEIRRGRGQRRLSPGIAPDPAMPRRAAPGARSPPGPRAPQLPGAPSARPRRLCAARAAGAEEPGGFRRG